MAFPSLGLSGLSCLGDVSLAAVVLMSWDGKPRFTEGQRLAQYRSNEFRVKAELDVGPFLLLISSSASSPWEFSAPTHDLEPVVACRRASIFL